MSTAALISMHEPSTLPGFGQRVTARTRSVASPEMVVDIFAGAGGASLGIEAALGRAVDKAINHNPLMIEMHEANHPATKHLPGDVWDYKPLAVTEGRPVGLLWASPDCTHFSRAKGGKPVSKKIRALAWVVIKWAKDVRPRVIIIENVPEFQTWGPLAADGRPDPAKKGQTFRRWKSSLERAGYVVEHRELVAADYGVPTIRKRFFLIARCDGEQINWPEQTHAPRKRLTEAGFEHFRGWRSAAECIDWSLRCRSIFERKRPLADATLRRIAKGIDRYVINAAPPGPFIVRCAHGENSASGVKRWGHGDRDLAEPLPTITASKDFALVAPFITKFRENCIGSDCRDPLHTITSGAGSVRPGGAAHAMGVIAPTLIQTGYGERDGQGPRAPGLDKPLGTVVAGGCKHALVAAFLAKHYGGVVGHGVNGPCPTITARHRFGLVTVEGVEYQICDIGLRMLTPRELLRAQFGRFADDYVLIGTQAQQVAGIGNSVPPELAELLVQANVRIRNVPAGGASKEAA